MSARYREELWVTCNVGRRIAARNTRSATRPPLPRAHPRLACAHKQPPSPPSRPGSPQGPLAQQQSFHPPTPEGHTPYRPAPIRSPNGGQPVFIAL